MIPNPNDYEFIWMVKNLTYFDTSIILEKGYAEHDFIITNKGDEWKTYLNKKERHNLSNKGFELLQNQFSEFKEKVKRVSSEVEAKLRQSEQKDLSLLKNSELREGFLETIVIVQQLWESYFFTEYFFYDKIQKEAEKTHDSELVKKIREMQEQKLRLRELINRTIYPGNVLEQHLKEIAKRTGRKDLYYLHYKEIASLLAEQIKRACYVLGKFNNWELVTGSEALEIIDNFDKTHFSLQNLQEFSGQTASPGFYKGKVKIIPTDLKIDLSQEITKMNKGDVLVTGTTGPEMLLACEKAGAIITEEGGICSHAAIISREFKIPCIVGTKIATHVLADGDFVEVNADKGIVKLLKKKEQDQVVKEV